MIAPCRPSTGYQAMMRMTYAVQNGASTRMKSAICQRMLFTQTARKYAIG